MLKNSLKSGIAALALMSAAPAAMAADLIIGLRAGPDSIDLTGPPSAARRKRCAMCLTLLWMLMKSFSSSPASP